jgi:hypothetical protein
LTDKAIDFLTELHQKFNNKRLFIIRRKKKQQALFDAGALPCFPIKTTNIQTIGVQQQFHKIYWTESRNPQVLLIEKW